MKAIRKKALLSAALLWLLLFSAASGRAEAAPLRMEFLNRGTVAVSVPEGVYLSWRLVGTEAYGTVFRVYRNGTEIAEVGDTTNYLDGDGTAEDRYLVLPSAGEAEEEVPVLPDAFLRIPLQPPVSGTRVYTANDAVCADLDGDGGYELILKWDPDDAFDSGATARRTGNVFLDAYRLSGEQLWRIDLGPNVSAGAHFTQMAAYDFDLDGRAELVCKTAPGSRDGKGRFVTEASRSPEIRAADNGADLTAATPREPAGGRVLRGDEYLTVFRGDTGAAMDTVYYPYPRGELSDWGDDWGNRSERYLTAVAYLDGERPYAVAWRGYYGKTTAAAYRLEGGRLIRAAGFDSSFPGFEAASGQGNHSLSVADVDGDGKDEILCGSLALDDDLRPLWISGRGHGDAQHLSDYDPTHEGMEYFSVHETAPYGMTLYDAATGRELFHADAAGDTGRGVMARVGYTDGYFELWGRDTKAYASYGGSDVREAAFAPDSINFRIFWDGDLYDELLDGENETESRVKISGRDGVIQVLPGTLTNNGTKNNVCLTADLFGDWREEIVARADDGTALLVFTTVIPTKHRLYTLMHDRTYRMQAAAENAGYNQPPHLGYYVSEDRDLYDRREDACRIRTVHEGITKSR